MSWASYLFGLIIVLCFIGLFYLWLKRKEKKSLKKLQGRYDKNEDKSRPTGEILKAQHLGYRNPESGTSESTTSINSGELNDEVKGRQLLSINEVNSNGRPSESFKTDKKTTRGFFKRRRNSRGERIE